MRFTTTDTESFYSLLPGQQAELTHWLDLVITASEPEDVTGTIFIDNFVQEEKARRLTSRGLVTAIKRRAAYTDHDLLSVVIEDNEIHETNTAKGIYFDTSQPAVGNYYSEYDIEFVHEYFSHLRYTGRIHLKASPPHQSNENYQIWLRRGLHRSVKSKTGCDFINYSIPPDSATVDAKIAIDPLDIDRGVILPRALTTEDLRTNSLRQHAQFIAEIAGIRAPEFLT